MSLDTASIDDHEGDASQAPTAPPGNDYPPGLEVTLQQLNANMATMSDILFKVYENQERHEVTLNERSPPGRERSRRRRRHRSSSSSEDNSSPDRSKRRKTYDSEDAMSLNASDEDVDRLINGPPASQAQNHTSADSATNDKGANDSLMKELGEALQDDEEKGPKINQDVADIAGTRWGKKLATEKLNTVLKKHKQPENCANMSVPRVNPEIWAPLNSFKKKADLRLANMQQALQKATFAVAKICDGIVTPDEKEKRKEMISASVDAMALMGHVVCELANLRKEQLKPTMKPEYQAICSKTEKWSTLLFGEDLPKQIREAKEAHRIASTVGTTKRDDRHKGSHGPWHNKNASTANRGKQPFLGKGSRPTFKKKHYPNQKNNQEKK